MSYAYGMKGAPAVGGGLPGLPRRGDSGGKVERSTYTRIVTPGSGVIEPPEGAKFMRVAVVGGGGGATTASVVDGSAKYASGAGGSCSATMLMPVQTINYTIGSAGIGGATGGNGGDSIATIGNRLLIGGGGYGGAFGITNKVNPPPGATSGGNFEYLGGSGAFSIFLAISGGGGAGPNGRGANGGAASANNGEFTGSGWGVGGGGSGWAEGGAQSGGAGGAGAAGGTLALRQPGAAVHIFGSPGQTVGTVSPYIGGAGGEMGGGGSRGTGNSGAGSAGNGGVGGIVVEWFY